MALLGVVSWPLFVDGLRLLSLMSFLVCSLTFSWFSFVSLIAVITSLYVLDRNRYVTTSKHPEPFPGGNPYRRHRRVREEEKVPAEAREKWVGQILDHVLHNVEECHALLDFEPIKRNTECIFSAKSLLWGCADYVPSLPLEANVERSLPAFIKFMTVGPYLHLDGFVFALPGAEFGQDVHTFGQGVRRVLKVISDADPSGFHCMNKSYLSKIGWSFEFNGSPIFITTFAPCYPESHSRYAFGCSSAFILFQPMYSFAVHDIGEDTASTCWDHPASPRDKIRVAYRDSGRPYNIRDTVIYPQAHDIVKPLNDGGGEVVAWWRGAEGASESEEEGADVGRESEEEEEEEEVLAQLLEGQEAGHTHKKSQ